MNNSDEIIKKLQMTPHPEGGHFKESYRDNNISLIYYLLKKNEILHFYDGDPLTVYSSKNGVTIEKTILNNNKNELSHLVIKNGTWFSMKSKGDYSLIGCTVAPPFDYDDFELAPKEWKPGKS